MTAFDTYGTNAYTAQELSDLLAGRLTVAFTEHDSDYLGIYFLATLADTTRIHVQPNAIPGDDGEDDLYEDEYPEMSVVLLAHPLIPLCLAEPSATPHSLRWLHGGPVAPLRRVSGSLE
ncbi:hypothetical protein ACR9VJ_04005 [Streptomyces sp. H49]|uniref:hypothetical protein n=1 Tax=Streptomyces sp. H49 TaxID=3444117 RepID=UPI003F4A8881